MARRIPKFLIAGMVITSLLVAGSAFAATQEDQGTMKAKVKVIGGALTLAEPGDTQLTDVTLTGSPVWTTGNLGAFTVTNARGVDTGWYLTMSAGNFENDDLSGNDIMIDGTDPEGKFEVTNAGYANVQGSGNVGFAIGDLGGVTPLTILNTGSSTANGLGVDKVTPAVKLDIPADTYAGDYTTTVTATLMSY